MTLDKGEHQHHWRVLIIDDDHRVCDSLQRMLVGAEREGEGEAQMLAQLNQLVGMDQQESEGVSFRCDVAFSGRVGLEWVRRGLRQQDPYAVVCIDMRMPDGWDGVTTAEQIRGYDKDVRIIFITAYSDYTLETIRRKVGLGFNFLSKPVRQSEYIQLVTSLAHAWNDARAVASAQRQLERYHQRMTASLVQEKEHIELVFESMNEAVVIVDRWGNVEKSNARLRKVTGWREGEIVGHPLRELFVEETAVERERDCLQVQPFSMIEERLAMVERSLERWVDSSPLAVMLLSIQGEIARVNYALEVLSGWSAETLMGRPQETLLPEMLQQKLEAVIRQQESIAEVVPLICTDGTVRPVEVALLPLRQAGAARVMMVLCDPTERQKLDLFRMTPLGRLFVDQGEEGINAEWVLKCRQGASIPVHVTGSPIYQEWEGQHRFNGAVLVLRDLRQLVEVEAARQAAVAKDEFLAAMSHELRTPLSAIIGNSELLIESASERLTSEESGMLRSIKVSGKTQLGLVNDILDLSKLNAGKYEIDEHELDLCQLRQDIEDIFSLRARSGGVQFRIVVVGERPEVQIIGDRKAMAQVVINLLSNAFKFTERGEVTLTIELQPEMGQMVFRVADQGIGMSAEVVDRLFQPFEQADRTIARRFGGTGLGLHISWSLVELMGGIMEVESEEGVGSTFSVTLPYHLGEVTSEVPLEEVPLPNTFSGRVLVAEDTPDLQALVRHMLEWLGVKVVVVGNGQEAVNQALQEHYDLILMDMQMPVMDGVEATRLLRQLNLQVPVVALTANVMQSHRQQFFEAGCNDFLVKPMEREALQKVLQRYLLQGVLQPEEDEGQDEALKSLFIQRLDAVREELERALEQQQWQQVAALAHMVKGSGGSFGYPHLTTLGEAVCDAMHDPAGELYQLLPQLSGELVQALREMCP